MAAIDFPASPTTGQIFAAPNGVVYQFTAGGIWIISGLVPSGNSAPGIGVGQVNFVTINVWINGPNTGAVGAAGQKWFVMGTALVTNNSGAFNYYGVRIFDGTTAYNSVTPSIANGYNTVVTTMAIVTLTGPVTFTLQAANFSMNGGGNMNGESYITAFRLS